MTAGTAMTAVVHVAGPPRAGVSSVAACLRDRMPAVMVVDTADPAGTRDVPRVADVVVFVVSAVAPVTESDCALAVSACRSTDAVIAVLAKIDDHRDWRGVLATNRQRLADCAARFASVCWVTAAAAPRLGEPEVADVVAALTAALSDPDLARRNTLRRWEALLDAVLTAVRDADAGHLARVSTLRVDRDALVRNHLRPGAASVRHPVQRARLELASAARQRCAALRTELLDAAAETTVVAEIDERVRRRCGEVLAEVDERVSVRLDDLASELGASLPEPSAVAEVCLGDPPLRQRRLESRVTTVLGAGFGFGAGLVVARWVTGLAPGLTVAGALVGAAVGLALTLWVVAARALLYRRAVLAQWIAEATVAIRAALDERIASRLLAFEAAVTTARSASVPAQRAGMAERVAECDALLRGHVLAARRAQGFREACEPGLARALSAVRDGLREPNPARTLVTDR
ncbi:MULTISPECIES: hypothetical protein [Mycobacteriaceae]|uniref:Uncharacterized protein n=1 Tax=Mycolicibacterium parafortuitum TaxID=39692 RepID=A0ACC6MIH9_MYCPF|nr:MULTISPECIES: hypothetical protein [Mycobacteriaceae]MDZ5086792.1 hypothetical protein [Mycolicibacterium parafortuitum]